MASATNNKDYATLNEKKMSNYHGKGKMVDSSSAVWITCVGLCFGWSTPE